MDFIKLQATGNDFVLIDARRMKRDWSALAKAMCHRHFGVGADGLLLILPSKVADFYMRMFNPDGSEAEACGNGLRCAARYAKESGLASGAEIGIETPTGIKRLQTRGRKSIQVAMGLPILAPSAIPVIVERKGTRDTAPVVAYPLAIGKRNLKITCVSIGNPHAVCFLEQPVADFPLAEVGPKVEQHPMFPNRVNFEIVNVISRSKLRARVWERGAGETLSCGTGACAIAVASRLKGLTDSPVDIILPGGTLIIYWDGRGEVLLSGPAEVVFEGKWKD
ncbi:MAG: diaminopimelate epimerase [Chloroflexi bacterium]|nr:diaminopimelate epimerase [Chloroflexota bacterium]